MRQKRELAEMVRDLIDDVVMLDAGSAEPGEMADAIAAVRAARAALGKVATLREKPRAQWPGIEQPLRERGPLVGVSNPLAAPLHLRADGQTTRGWAVYGPAYEGSPGDMHGGVVAAAFDDLLGCAQMVAPVSGRTGTLTVRFRTPSPIGQRIDYEGRVDRVEGRKVFCSGEARCGDVLLADAEAIFVQPREWSAREG